MKPWLETVLLAASNVSMLSPYLSSFLSSCTEGKQDKKQQGNAKAYACLDHCLWSELSCSLWKVSGLSAFPGPGSPTLLALPPRKAECVPDEALSQVQDITPESRPGAGNGPNPAHSGS